MAHPPDPSQETRGRLLDAAGAVFAERGFREATIRDICQRAGANIAAVNYHFGDKETLYREVLAFTARQSLQQHPIGGGVDPAAPAPERLAAFVRGYLERLMGEGRPAWFGRLVAREIAEPTAALDHIAETFARPQFLALSSIVAEILGPAATEPLIRRGVMSIIGQCLFYMHARPMIQRLAPQQGFGPEDRREIAAHITRFSLAALTGQRECRAKDPQP